MKDMNKIFIMGRLGADPAPRETKSGVKMVTFPVATARKTKDAGATTDWHRVVAWGKQSEHCAAYLKKGQSVLIEGSIKTRKYSGKDGVDRMSTEVHLDDVTFLNTGFVPQKKPSDDAESEGASLEKSDRPSLEPDDLDDPKGSSLFGEGPLASSA